MEIIIKHSKNLFFSHPTNKQTNEKALSVLYIYIYIYCASAAAKVEFKCGKFLNSFIKQKKKNSQNFIINFD